MTDSELLTGVWATSFLYALVCVPAMRGIASFETYAIRSSTFIAYSSLCLGKLNHPSKFWINGDFAGKRGIIVTTILNSILGIVFSKIQLGIDGADATRLRHLWLVLHIWVNTHTESSLRAIYQARTISESCIALISIAKFNETFTRLEQADKHKTEFLCRMSHELR